MDSEKVGGRERVRSQMDAFNAVLAECSLTDIGFRGYPYMVQQSRGPKHSEVSFGSRVREMEPGCNAFPPQLFLICHLRARTIALSSSTFFLEAMSLFKVEDGLSGSSRFG